MVSFRGAWWLKNIAFLLVLGACTRGAQNANRRMGRGAASDTSSSSDPSQPNAGEKNNGESTNTTSVDAADDPSEQVVPPTEVSGQYLTYDNARTRCAYQEASAGLYTVNCRAVIADV